MAQYCSFHLADRLYGLPIVGIQEILRHLEVTPVPTAPAYVIGLINLRGQIATVVDLRKRLGLPPAPQGLDPIHIVADLDGEAVSFTADRAGDVFDLEPSGLEPCPGPADAEASPVLGVFALECGLMHILDARALLDATVQPAETRAAT
ncbi:MAG: chemotaxis protein CheW [Fibrobacteres bacterium]|nr:chemotaxis protein CheW [Fibrobacterota bacterium]